MVLVFHCSSAEGKQVRMWAVKHDVLLIVDSIAVVGATHWFQSGGEVPFGSVSSVSHPVVHDERVSSRVPVGSFTFGR